MAELLRETSDITVLGRLLVGRSPLGMAALDGEAHIIRFANVAFCRLAGKPIDALVGRPVAGAFEDASFEGAAALLNRVYRSGKAGYHSDSVHAHDQEASTERTYTVWPIAGYDRPLGLFVQVTESTFGDTAPRRPAESEEILRLTNQQLLVAGLYAQEEADEARRGLTDFNDLLERLSDAIVISDATGQVVLMNQAARNLSDHVGDGMGVSRDIFDRLEKQRLDGTPLPAEEWPANRALRGEQFDDLEIILLHRDGAMLRLLCSGNSIRDQWGHVVLGIVVLRDVTTLRQLEMSREHSISALAHDLSTPLTAVKGYAQMVQRAIDRGPPFEEDRVRGYLYQINATVTRMASLITALLADGRMLARQDGRHEIEALDLATALRRIASDLQESTDTCRIALEIEEASYVGDWDASLLERVLSNVLSNAFKYSGGDGGIEVMLTRQETPRGPWAVLIVRDHGIGIPAGDLPHIFERHYRARNVGAIEGSGIGLSWVKETVEGQGGTISAENAEGGGVTATIRLPLWIPRASATGDDVASIELTRPPRVLTE